MIDLKKFRFDKEISQKELANKTHLDQSRISKYETGKEVTFYVEQKILEAYPDARLYIIDSNDRKTRNEGRKDSSPAWQPIGNDAEMYGFKEIPYIEQEVFATISEVMGDAMKITAKSYVHIPAMVQGEYALHVSGNSMKGYINHGDMIIVRHLKCKNELIFGDPYLIITRQNNLRTVKFINEDKRDPSVFILTPYNIEQFDSQRIKRKDVIAIFKVEGLIRGF